MGDGLVGDGGRRQHRAAVAAAVPRLERDVSLITDTGFGRQQSDVSLYSAVTDGAMGDTIESDRGYMDERIRPGRFESDVCADHRHWL